MNIYTVYTKPNDPNALENAIFIKEGFSWFAAILHFFWAFYHRMWLVGAVLLAIEITLTSLQLRGYVQMETIESIKIGILLLIGANFNDLYRKNLEQKGYVFQDVISGKNEEEARCKYMTDILQCNTFGSGKEGSIVL